MARKKRKWKKEKKREGVDDNQKQMTQESIVEGVEANQVFQLRTLHKNIASKMQNECGTVAQRAICIVHMSTDRDR
jgi:hypothetical protein